MHEKNRSPCTKNLTRRLLDSAPASREGHIVDSVVSFELEPITDASKGPRKIKGTAKEADKVNLNRYYFSLECCTDMVNAAQEPMQSGELFGLVEHPDFWQDGRKGRIENIGIRYDKLWMDDKLMRFEGVLVDTVRGKDLLAVLDAKIKVGMSTNVNGVLKYQQAKDVEGLDWPNPEEWIGVVQVGARLDTIDAVLTPADLEGGVQAADALRNSRQEEPTVKNLQELKEKHPDIYAQAVADGKKQAETEGGSVESQLAAERAARLKLEGEIKDSRRSDIARTALADAKLPKLGKSGEIDLDARFEKRVTDAALRAESDDEARTEVAALIAERKLSVKDADTVTDASKNNPNIPRKGEEAQKSGPNTLSSIRAGLGLR